MADLDALIGELASDPAYASGERKFERKLGLDEAAAIAARLHDEVDRGVEQREAMIAAQGWRLACTVGCNACCEEPIMVYRPEAARVARWLEQPENAAARAAFRAAYPSWRQRQGDLPARLGDVFVRDPSSYVDAHARAWAKRVLCAFNLDGACSIYPVRPTVCRVAHALDSADGCVAGSVQERQRATFVPLDRFVATTRSLMAAAHHAARGPKRRVDALCTVVHEMLRG